MHICIYTIYIYICSRELLRLETNHNHVVSLEFMYIEPEKLTPWKRNMTRHLYCELPSSIDSNVHFIQCRWQFCKEVTAIAAGHAGAGPQVGDPNKKQPTKANTFDGENSHKSSLWGKHQLVDSFSRLWGMMLYTFLHIMEHEICICHMNTVYDLFIIYTSHYKWYMIYVRICIVYIVIYIISCSLSMPMSSLELSANHPRFQPLKLPKTRV